MQRLVRRGLRFIVLIRDYVRDYESTYILRDRLQHFCHWGTQMRIFLRFYSRADLKGDSGLPALILSPILLNCQQNLSSVQHLIFGLLDQAPGWVPGWAHEKYADHRFTRFLVLRLHTPFRLMVEETFPIPT